MTWAFAHIHKDLDGFRLNENTPTHEEDHPG